MAKAHYDALEKLLPAGLNKHRGSAPGKLEADRYPYVVLGGDPGQESTEAASGEPDSLSLRFKLTYAGLSFDQVLITIDEVRAAVSGQRLVVPGWSCGLLRHEPLVDIRTDFNVTVPGLAINPVYAVDELSLFSAR
jgi:hypothetical protein